VPVVFKVSTVLDKEPLEGFLVSLIKAGLVYLKSLSLLERIEIYNFLLELANLFIYFFNRVSFNLGNLKGSKNLRHYYILILYS